MIAIFAKTNNDFFHHIPSVSVFGTIVRPNKPTFRFRDTRARARA